MNVAIIPMVWSDKDTNGSMENCAACGRKLTGQRLMVEVIDGGCSVAAPGLGPDTTDAGYMGFFPVGSGCARKHFRGFTWDLAALEAVENGIDMAEAELARDLED